MDFNPRLAVVETTIAEATPHLTRNPLSNMIFPITNTKEYKNAGLKYQFAKKLKPKQLLCSDVALKNNNRLKTDIDLKDKIKESYGKKKKIR